MMFHNGKEWVELDLIAEVAKMKEPKEESDLVRYGYNILYRDYLIKAHESIENDKTGTKRGHVVGADAGRDDNPNLPRNSQCMCGSGKKAKKCCVTLHNAIAVLQERREELQKEDSTDE